MKLLTHKVFTIKELLPQHQQVGWGRSLIDKILIEMTIRLIQQLNPYKAHGPHTNRRNVLKYCSTSHQRKAQLQKCVIGQICLYLSKAIGNQAELQKSLPNKCSLLNDEKEGVLKRNGHQRYGQKEQISRKQIDVYLQSRN